MNENVLKRTYGILDNSYEGTDIVEKYNPISDEWTTDLAPMPSKRSVIGAASINGSIYVLGGERRQGPLTIMNDKIPPQIHGPSKHLCQLRDAD
jgi:hypothetical protein